MGCDVEVHDLSAFMLQHDEAEQDAERGRGDGEEVNALRAVGPMPSLTPVSPSIRPAAPSKPSPAAQETSLTAASSPSWASTSTVPSSAAFMTSAKTLASHVERTALRPSIILAHPAVSTGKMDRAANAPRNSRKEM